MRWLFVFLIVAVVASSALFIVDYRIRESGDWYRARYSGARQCYHTGENPYRVKQENMVFYDTATECLQSLTYHG